MPGEILPRPPVPLGSRQLPLPLGGLLPLPLPLPRGPEVLRPAQVWRGLALPTRQGVRQPFLRVLGEALHADDQP